MPPKEAAPPEHANKILETVHAADKQPTTGPNCALKKPEDPALAKTTRLAFPPFPSAKGHSISTYKDTVPVGQDAASGGNTAIVTSKTSAKALVIKCQLIELA